MKCLADYFFFLHKRRLSEMDPHTEYLFKKAIWEREGVWEFVNLIKSALLSALLSSLLSTPLKHKHTLKHSLKLSLKLPGTLGGS